MSPGSWSEKRKPQPSRKVFTWPWYWPWPAERDLSRAAPPLLVKAKRGGGAIGIAPIPALLMPVASYLPLGDVDTTNSTCSPTCRAMPAAITCFLPRRTVPWKRGDVAKPQPSWKLFTSPPTRWPRSSLWSFTATWTFTAMSRPFAGFCAISKVTSSPGRSRPSRQRGLCLSPKNSRPSKEADMMRPQPCLKLLTVPASTPSPPPPPPPMPS
mmetsp:Transcript_70462/g.187306  ORF Transcript_70462/g.187306 Transcript_70462/m.187306 type:complete len:212 (-) Transcript_70462:292-927(-)